MRLGEGARWPSVVDLQASLDLENSSSTISDIDVGIIVDIDVGASDQIGKPDKRALGRMR